MLRSAMLAPSKAALALAIGALFTVAVIVLSPSSSWIAGAVLSFALAWATMVDIDRMILPDAVTLPLIGSGLAFAAAAGWPLLFDRAIGAAAGYLSLVLVAHGYRVLRKREGLGRGDAKLFAAAGAWLGWAMLPMTMLAACFAAVGLVAVRLALGKTMSRESPIAFGPFLAAGLWAVWLVDSITWEGGA